MDREFRNLRWGLIPSWAKDPAMGSRMINARSETVASKPAYRSAFRERRCLILADGFYEWRPVDKGKQPYYIALQSGDPFAFAGLWERWEGPDGTVLETCTLLTTEPNDLVRPIHDRMPVILAETNYHLWLDTSVEKPDALKPLLGPYPADTMEAFPVGLQVNNPRNDEPSCVDPLSAR